MYIIFLGKYQGPKGAEVEHTSFFTTEMLGTEHLNFKINEVLRTQ